MQEQKLYEYAVIRLVPKPEREEFFNVGLILFSKKEKFIKVKIHLCEEKLRLLDPSIDLDEVKKHLDSFVKIANGDKSAGSIAQLEIPERFRWLTAVKSAVIQTSRPHPGATLDLEKTFERLFEELVL
ncbi:DUF3037 domain-containing protein [Chryseobacterium sp. SC28]|uniref:DUF3037 domain-containing protein n=1 Tax=Chryseobacterium sp. SC28 TaxID=2268028 RepID=UPI000F65598C|nr:DUF3037 domain-containing protein [Chryseobacterium sp. SC28]RRQ45576.1 DUF3037 domain-containing protein [Chryseobacterium sp. SC28]